MQISKFFVVVFFFSMVSMNAQSWSRAEEVNPNWHVLGVRESGIRLARLESKPHIHSFASQIAAFYLDDKELLPAFVAGILQGEPVVRPCYGVDYQLFICDGSRPVFSFSVNLECELLYMGIQSYHFSTDSLLAWQERLKEPVSRKLDFASIEKARNGFPELEKKEGLLLAIPPDWLRFDGVYIHEQQCDSGETACFDQRMQRMNDLTELLKNQFPEAPLEVRIDGGSKTAVRFAIYTDSASGVALGRQLPGKWSPFRTFYLNTWWDY